MNRAFDGFDLHSFWVDSDYARDEYVCAAFSDADVKRIETMLGYRLPSSYIALMRTQNGGMPRCTFHRTPTSTSWAEDGIAITGIFGIGTELTNSLGGECGSRFWVDTWGYPPIGIYFADCPSAGHDMMCLDYSHCGPHGEPRVVHVDQELGYAVTVVAPTFDAFIRGLISEPSTST